jgi:hypothetical protein
MVIKCIALEKNKKCKGGKLNANSSEFLSIVLDITIDEAKTYLRNRNSSPFYKENFNTKEEYKKSQTRNIQYFIDIYGETIENHIKQVKNEINRI